MTTWTFSLLLPDNTTICGAAKDYRGCDLKKDAIQAAMAYAATAEAEYGQMILFKTTKAHGTRDDGTWSIQRQGDGRYRAIR